MQEPKLASRRKSYSDLTKLHQRALQEAYTCAVYVEDAEQGSEPELATFFRTVCAQATHRAEVAQHLLDEHRSPTTHGRPVKGPWHQAGDYPGHYPEGMRSTPS